MSDFSSKISMIIDDYERYGKIIKKDFEKVKNKKYINVPKYFYYLILFIDENIIQKMKWTSIYNIDENIEVIKNLVLRTSKDKIIDYIKTEYIDNEILEKYTILLFIGLMCNFKYDELINNKEYLEKILKNFKYFIINIIRNEKSLI